MKKTLLLVAPFLLFITCPAHGQIISTFAGSGVAGINDGGPAIDAGLSQPTGIAIDRAGNTYISDFGNNRIRKVNAAGIISTIAGTGTPGYSGDEKAATGASINGPHGIAVDNAGNVYFADAYNYCIRKINDSGVISTFAGNDTSGFKGDGGPATAAELDEPTGVAVDAQGNVLIADQGNNRIRVVSTAGIIYTIAGTGSLGHNGDGGPATAAALNRPYTVMVDAAGNLYVSEQRGGGVRKINIFNRTIITVAGSDSVGFGGDKGPATLATLAEAEGLALDAAGNLYISDTYNDRIRQVDKNGIITTYAGTDSAGYSGDGMIASTAQLFFPVGVALDAAGNLFVADQGNNRIRRITPAPEAVPAISNATSKLTLYPNPSDGSFTFCLSSNADEQVNVVITTVAGETVKEFITVTNKPLNMRLDAAPGVYFVIAVTSQGKHCAKVVVR